MTAHFVDKNWHRHDYPIALEHFETDEEKSGLRIGQKIHKMLKIFNIDESRIVGMLRDGAGNMRASADILEIQR